MCNVYILLRSLLCACFSIIATKTPRYLYSASGCSRATKLFPITKYFSHIRPDFEQVGILVDPEKSFAHYSRLATYCHVCLLLQRGVKPFLPAGYTKIYPLRIRLRIIPMSSHVNQLFAGQEMASVHIVAPLCLGLQNAFLSQSLRHYTTLPIDRTNGYDQSYRSHTNKPFGSSPDFLTEHSAF